MHTETGFLPQSSLGVCERRWEEAPPREAARMAMENDVHVLGVSSLAGGHSTLIPSVINERKMLGREDILVFAASHVFFYFLSVHCLIECSF
jgi:hypothetical protein